MTSPASNQRFKPPTKRHGCVIVTSSNTVRCYAVVADVSAELHPARCIRAAIIPGLHGRNSCRNFRLTDITRSGDHPFTRELPRKDGGGDDARRSRNTNARPTRGDSANPCAPFTRRPPQSGDGRGIRCRGAPRERCSRLLLAGELADRRRGRGGRGGSLIHGDPESIGDACNHLVTAALCGCESRAGYSALP